MGISLSFGARRRAGRATARATSGFSIPCTEWENLQFPDTQLRKN